MYEVPLIHWYIHHTYIYIYDRIGILYSFIFHYIPKITSSIINSVCFLFAPHGSLARENPPARLRWKSLNILMMLTYLTKKIQKTCLIYWWLFNQGLFNQGWIFDDDIFDYALKFNQGLVQSSSCPNCCWIPQQIPDTPRPPHRMGHIALHHARIQGPLQATKWAANARILAVGDSSTCINVANVWLVVWTPLTNISQLGWLFPIYGKIENVPNHQPVI